MVWERYRGDKVWECVACGRRTDNPSDIVGSHLVPYCTAIICTPSWVEIVRTKETLLAEERELINYHTDSVKFREFL